MNPLTAPVIMPSTPGSGVVFAAGNLFQSVEFYITVGLLVSVLLAGAVIIHYLDKWRNKQLANEDDSPLTLSNYRQLYEQGELSEEEYAKVRDRLAAKMKANAPVRVTPQNPATMPTLPKTPDAESE